MREGAKERSIKEDAYENGRERTGERRRTELDAHGSKRNKAGVIPSVQVGWRGKTIKKIVKSIKMLEILRFKRIRMYRVKYLKACELDVMF